LNRLSFFLQEVKFLAVFRFEEHSFLFVVFKVSRKGMGKKPCGDFLVKNFNLRNVLDYYSFGNERKKFL